MKNLGPYIIENNDALLKRYKIDLNRLKNFVTLSKLDIYNVFHDDLVKKIPRLKIKEFRGSVNNRPTLDPEEVWKYFGNLPYVFKSTVKSAAKNWGGQLPVISLFQEGSKIVGIEITGFPPLFDPAWVRKHKKEFDELADEFTGAMNAAMQRDRARGYTLD